MSILENEEKLAQMYDLYQEQIEGALKRQIEILSEKEFDEFMRNNEELTDDSDEDVVFAALKLFFKGAIWELEDASFDMAKESVEGDLDL